MLQHYRRLLDYNRWANAESLASLRMEGGSFPRSLNWMAHIIGAEYLWISRVRQEPSPLGVWPELDLEACAARLDDLADMWPQVLAGLSEDDLSEGVAYRNTKGEFWSSTVGDILTHVVIHSGYHRGQIAADLRAGGGTPAYTDYIHATRQGLLE